jgi:AraC-like DNA-binding protein
MLHRAVSIRDEHHIHSLTSSEYISCSTQKMSTSLLALRSVNVTVLSLLARESGRSPSKLAVKFKDQTGENGVTVNTKSEI